MANERESEKEFQRKVVGRAAADPEFRKKLLADPRKAIQEVGVILPADLKIKFIEKDADVDLMVVLPDSVPAGNELSPDELELVAGGCVFLSGCGNTCTNGSCAQTSSTS